MSGGKEHISSIEQKVLASWVNMGVAVAVSLPWLWFVDVSTWKVIAIGGFFVYNVAFAGGRCLGMRLVDTFPDDPGINWPYIVLYTAGFATLFYWVVFPADLFLLNGLAQTVCLYRTGNTLHGWLAGYSTVNVVGHLINMSRTR